MQIMKIHIHKNCEQQHKNIFKTIRWLNDPGERLMCDVCKHLSSKIVLEQRETRKKS